MSRMTTRSKALKDALDRENVPLASSEAHLHPIILLVGFDLIAAERRKTVNERAYRNQKNFSMYLSDGLGKIDYEIIQEDLELHFGKLSEKIGFQGKISCDRLLRILQRDSADEDVIGVLLASVFIIGYSSLMVGFENAKEIVERDVKKHKGLCNVVKKKMESRLTGTKPFCDPCEKNWEKIVNGVLNTAKEFNKNLTATFPRSLVNERNLRQKNEKNDDGTD